MLGRMSDPLPPRTIAEIAFVGRGGGAVKALSGFKKGHHTVPDAANPATEAFLARICAAELGAEAEKLFQAVRTGLTYRRAEIGLSLTSPLAILSTKDFVVELGYAFDAADPSRYVTTLALRHLRNPEMTRTAEFDAIFARRFTELSFGLAKGVRIEAVIDAIEGLEPAAGLTVSYPSDCRECEIGVPGVGAHVRCLPAALELIFPGPGSPAELIDAFDVVRRAFAVSPPLRALIAQ